MTTHEGNRGRWYREHERSATQERVEQLVWSSYGNRRSFWIEKRHLVQTLRDVGFSSVYEQYDFLDNNVTDRSIEQRNRSLFLAVK